MNEYEDLKGPTEAGLLERGIININEVVSQELADKVSAFLDVLECNDSPPVEIRFRTPGGDIIAGMHLYDRIRLYRGLKTGVVYTTAFSMGATLLQACDVRVTLPNSFVLIHNFIMNGLSSDILQDPEKVKKAIAEFLVIQERIHANIAKRTGRSIEEIRAKCLENKKMTSYEALEFGLVDSIWGEENDK